MIDIKASGHLHFHLSLALFLFLSLSQNSSSAVVDKYHPPERHGLSSAWDETHGYEPRKRSRRGSVDRNIKGINYHNNINFIPCPQLDYIDVLG